MAAPDARERMGAIALTTFALNGLFLSIAEQLTAPAGLTATRWQVLGAVLHTPLTQAEIARRMGITRQSVRRTSLQLVAEGLLELIPNPSSRKAMLLQSTKKGYAAVSKIKPQHAEFAKLLEKRLGKGQMSKILETMAELRQTLEAIALLPQA
jgi:DNA-binding MarR family transcriptional regulator